MLRLYVAFLICCTFALVSTSHVYYEDGSSKYVNTPRLKAGPTHFDLTAPLTYDAPFTSGRCKDSSNVDDATGKIILILGEVEGCTRFFKRVKPLQDEGAVAIVFARSHDRGDPGYFYFWARCSHNDCDGIKIPLVELDQENSKKLYERLSQGENVTINITNDHNYYAEPVDSGAYYVFSVVTISVSVGIMCFAVYRLYQSVTAKGWSLSLSNMLFGLEIIGSLIRIVWSIDPFAFYFIYPTPFTHLISTFHIVPFVASNLLLACYWQESITSFQIMERIPRLRRFKWPALVFIAVLSITDITTGALRGFATEDISNISYYIVSFFYAAVAIGVGGFFFVTGFALLRKLKSQSVLKLSGERPRNSLYKLTALVITVGCGAVIMLILALLYSVILVKKAWLMYMFMVCLFLIVDSMCFAQLAVFQPPEKTDGATTEMKLVKSASDSPVWSLSEFDKINVH